MTPTQIARRSDALYADGTCGMTRRVLCDMVAHREADMEELQELSRELLDMLEWAAWGNEINPAKLVQCKCRARQLGVTK